MIEGFRKRLKSRETLIGTLITLGSPEVAEILAGAGFDWLFIDMEHGPLHSQTVQAILQGAGTQTPCLVRVPCNAEVWFKQALDIGSAGVIVPQVNSKLEAENAVKWCRYPPIGNRSVGVGRAHGYGASLQSYIDCANEQISLVVQVEHIQAVENVEEILTVPGLDAILIGPYDLSASMGKPGKVSDPDVQEAIRKVRDACWEHSMPIGIFGAVAEGVEVFMKQGFSLIAVGTDTIFLDGAARKTLNLLGRGR